jgi:hypothetical protein
MEIPATPPGGAVGRGNLPAVTVGKANQQPDAEAAKVAQKSQNYF